MRAVLSIDAETDGLWGNPFAIGAIVYIDGVEQRRFFARLPDSFVSDGWCQKNVLAALNSFEQTENPTHENLNDMLYAFSVFYNWCRADFDKNLEVVCHMGYIVEAWLLRLCADRGYIGQWDAPYPLYDVSGNLQAAGYDPTGVDSAAKKLGLEIADYGTTHNPLYDAEVAGKVYMELTSDIHK